MHPGAVFRELTVTAGDARAVVRPEHAAALCAGHFPGDPLVPGAYLAALMADVAGALMAPAALAEVERCLFLHPVGPEAEIVVSARPLGDGRVRAEVRAAGAPAARAVLRFA